MRLTTLVCGDDVIGAWKSMEYIDMLEFMVKGIEFGQCDCGEGIVDTGGMEGKGENRIS